MLIGKTKTTVLFAVSALAIGAVACDRNATDNGTTNTPPPPAAAPAGAATITGGKVASDPLADVENKASLKQYPDETKFDPPRQAQLITGFAVQVRESPRGEAVASAETAEPVREVARDAKGEYYLVVFPDPKDASKDLAGWIYKDALENNGWAADNAPEKSGTSKAKTGGEAKSALLKCARGESHVRTSMDFCAKTCKDDGGCDRSQGEVCDGLGFKVNETSGKLANTNYCITSAAPGTLKGKGSEHGASAPLDDMNRNYNPKDPGHALDNSK